MIVKQVPPETAKQLNKLHGEYKQAEHEYFVEVLRTKQDLRVDPMARFSDNHEFLVVAQ